MHPLPSKFFQGWDHTLCPWSSQGPGECGHWANLVDAPVPVHFWHLTWYFFLYTAKDGWPSRNEEQGAQSWDGSFPNPGPGWEHDHLDSYFLRRLCFLPALWPPDSDTLSHLVTSLLPDFWHWANRVFHSTFLFPNFSYIFILLCNWSPRKKCVGALVGAWVLFFGYLVHIFGTTWMCPYWMPLKTQHIWECYGPRRTLK